MIPSVSAWLLSLGLVFNSADAASMRGTPIDLFAGGAGSFAPFIFGNFDVLQRNVQVVNDGQTIRVDLPQTYTVSGGGLSETYVPLQFHLHWDMNGAGSEHTKFGEKYSAELHVVTRKQSLTTAQALNSGDHDALAVLGFFLKEVGQENVRLRDFITAVTRVQNHDVLNTTAIPTNFNLMRLLYNGQRNYGEFFRYEGSLTTPPFNEIVRWTVFSEPIEISTKQMERIRSVSARGRVIEENFRPIQSRDGRTVLVSGPGIREEQARHILSPPVHLGTPEDKELSFAKTGVPETIVIAIFVVLAVVCLASVAGVIYLARSIRASRTKQVS